LSEQKTDDVIAAQQVVCAVLVEACEQALLAVRTETGQAATSTNVRTGLIAAAMLESVLATWRETLRVLRHEPTAEPEATFYGAFTPVNWPLTSQGYGETTNEHTS
jgi:hypothetical protein